MNRLASLPSAWPIRVLLACGLLASITHAASDQGYGSTVMPRMGGTSWGGDGGGWKPGAGIKAGRLRVSPFADFSVGYDSNVRLAEGEIRQLRSDGSYELQETKIDDFFSQVTAGVGLGRELESEWDFRLRAWYDTRLFSEETSINYDSLTAEASARYWPDSDKYMINAGGKYRDAQDVERVPSSASLTMPGELPLPYLEERSDRLKRINVDGYANASLLALNRTDLSIGTSISSLDYKDNRLFDYWNWLLNGSAGYRFTEKTSFFGVLEYQTVEGDALSEAVPVTAFRLGFRTRPREKIEYHISAGVKTYEHFTDPTGRSKEQTMDFDYDALLNWRYSEKLNFFGKAWTDVGAAIQQSEDTRRTYAGQFGANYAFMKRLSAVGAISYRLDDYDFPIVYGDELIQNKTELWQLMGRLVLTPRANTFWKLYTEVSYEQGDNDLDDYDQWLVWLGASVWY